MIKKLIFLLNILIIGLIWTFLFMIISNIIFVYVWNFNFLYAQNWQTIIDYWNHGGVIRTSTDTLFLTLLIFTPILWITGWFLLTKYNFFHIFLYPLNIYNRFIIKKYGSGSSRIVLKNLKSSQKMIEDIKNNLDSIKPEDTKEVKNIRSGVLKQLTEIKNK